MLIILISECFKVYFGAKSCFFKIIMHSKICPFVDVVIGLSQTGQARGAVGCAPHHKSEITLSFASLSFQYNCPFVDLPIVHSNCYSRITLTMEPSSFPDTAGMFILS